MFGSPFFRRLFLPYLVLIVATVAVVGLVAVAKIRASYLSATRHRLIENARLVARSLTPDLAERRIENVRTTVRELSQLLSERITVIQKNGTVVADSQTDADKMGAHHDRPEIIQAGAVGEGSDLRVSQTVGAEMFYSAQRITAAGETWFVRLSVDVAELRDHLGAVYRGLGIAATSAALIAGLLAYLFARRHARPVAELSGFAQALSSGDLDRRTLERGPGELGSLASSLNTVAQSLRSAVADATREKGELLTIVASMSEGLIATDRQQRIVLVNQSAGKLLAFDVDAAPGKLLCEAVLNEKILKAASDVLEDGQRRSFQTGPHAGRYLEVTVGGYPIDGPPQGLVVLAHDATQSVRYQDLRKEFVANVSHELRTPLTVIKGYVETLRDGAIGDAQLASRYLATVERHTNQLGNLVDDLLEISRLESLPELPQRTNVDLGAIARKAVELLTRAAEAKKQELSVAVSSALPPVVGNADYLERAVANLVDNAIKYTPGGGRIRVSVRPEPAAVVVEVTDNGIGIPSEDIPRIFERFYRVDRSRSREMGGTGLGLSIVKHIAQSHGGSVDVTSTPGSGSTFVLRIPLPGA